MNGPNKSSKPETLGVRLRRARLASGKTQAEVGKEFKISGRSVSQWETDVTRPSSEKLSRLAELLEVSLDWILQSAEVTGQNRTTRKHGPVSKAERAAETQAFHKDSGTGVVRIPELLPSIDPPEDLRDLNDTIINRNKWTMPLDVLRHFGIESPEHLYIKRSVQDAMMPTIRPGDFVLISNAPDCMKLVPRRMYLLFDGISLVIRRVQPQLHEDMKFWALIADNPQVETRLVTSDKCRMLGRIVGVLAFLR